METLEFVKRTELEYRRNADSILFDIEKVNWKPDYSILELFCKGIYLNLVDFYKRVEKTEEYFLTGEIFFARSCLNNDTLGFCVGEGFTRSEICSTHTIGWEFGRLLDAYKVKPESFNLNYLLVAYKRRNPDRENEIKPKLDELILV